MNLDSVVDDVVLFELQTAGPASELSTRLRALAFYAWAEPDEGSWLVGVELGRAESDFVILFRSVSGWLAEAGLPGLTFHLDGRVYVLWAAEVEAATVA